MLELVSYLHDPWALTVIVVIRLIQRTMQTVDSLNNLTVRPIPAAHRI